ncbi:hypothetical protein KFU94_50165 [Chloroflexi bacterium TSY]|nr:hypothetical protein [Chloroflexi bacterium TSY]
MATVTLDLEQELYQRLETEAIRNGKPLEALVIEWVVERLSPKPTSERERAREVLRAAGLLAEPSAQMRKIAAQSTMPLDEVQSALDRTGGKPLSEIIIDQRGPKR